MSEISLDISQEAYSKIMGYARIASGEVSGFARFNTRTHVIDKVFPLLNQVCSSAHTEIDRTALAEFIFKPGASQANVFWHSHADMSCFFSSEDTNTINELVSNMPWLISIVVNKKKEYKCRVDISEPMRLYHADVHLAIDYHLPLNQLDKMREEIRAVTSPPKYLAMTHERNMDIEFPTGSEQDEVESKGNKGGVEPSFQKGRSVYILKANLTDTMIDMLIKQGYWHQGPYLVKDKDTSYHSNNSQGEKKDEPPRKLITASDIEFRGDIISE